MADFCIETTAIHDEYIEEYNSNFGSLSDKLDDVEFFCLTSNPEKIIKKHNIIPIDIKKYTQENFSKSYDHKTGFCPILQATRFGMREAYERGYLKILHLQTDAVTIDVTFDTQILSNHFKNGIYFDMGGTVANLLYAKDPKVKHLIDKFGLKSDIEKMPFGDDPTVFIKLKNKEIFLTFLDNVDKLCEETYKFEHFTTGLAAELSIGMHITGVRSYYNYHGVLHMKHPKYFDVDHNHLHVQHYIDRDPQMKKNLPHKFGKSNA